MLEIKQGSTVQPLQLPSSTPQSTAGSIDRSAWSLDALFPALMESAATTTRLQARYHPLPARSTSSTLAPRTGKRKQPTSCPIHYFEDSPTEDGEGDEYGGDESSSGKSVPFDDRAQVKRLQVSRTIRPSARSRVLDVESQDASNLSSPVPVGTRSSLDVPGASTGLLRDCKGISSTDATAITTPISPADLHPPDSLVTNMDASHTDPQAPEVSEGSICCEVGTVAETNTTKPKLIASPAPVMDIPITAMAIPPPVSACPIDVEEVPAFLLSHAKGNHHVNIFKYLNELQDPRFQQVLSHYIKFKISDGSNTSGSLPTAGRPVGITQWTSRARPASLPDYKKGGRTFCMFVDSILCHRAYFS